VQSVVACRDLPQLRKLESAAADPAFLRRWADVKLQAKRRAAAFLEERTGVTVKPDAMFDVQARSLCVALCCAERFFLRPAMVSCRVMDVLTSDFQRRRPSLSMRGRLC
jgi:Carbohydrate phosphorylase